MEENLSLLIEYIKKRKTAALLLKSEGSNVEVQFENAALSKILKQLGEKSFSDVFTNDAEFNEKLVQYLLTAQNSEQEVSFSAVVGEVLFKFFISSVAPSLFVLKVKQDIDEFEKLLNFEYEKFQEMARVGFWELDLLRNVVYWSKQVRKIHEVDDNFIPTPSNTADFYEEEVREMVKNAFLKTIKTGEPYDYKAPIITAKNNKRYVRATGRAIQQGGKTIKLYGTFQDITKSYVTSEQLKNLSKNVPGAIFRYTIYPDGSDKFNYLSGSAKRLWGYSLEELQKDTSLVWNSILPEHIDHMQASIAESAKNLSPWKEQWEIVHKEGYKLWHQGHGTPQRNRDGSTTWDTLLIDITEEKNFQFELTESQQRFESLVNSIDGILWEADAENFIFSYISPQVEKIVGYTPEEWLASDTFWADHIHPQEREEAVNYCIAQTKAGKDHHFEYHFKTKSGKYKWLKDYVTVINEKGKPVRLKGIMLDINKSKEKDLLFAQEKKLNEELLRNMPVAFFLYGKNHEMLRWNKFLADTIGYSDKEIAKMKAEHFFPKRNEKFVKQYLDEIFSKGQVSDLEAEVITKSGKELISSINGSKIKYDGKDAILGVARDITESKRYQKELKKKQKELQNILDNSLDIICTTDLEGTFLQVSQASERILGYKPDELVGRSIYDFLADDSIEETAKIGEFIREGNEISHHQNIYLTKEGKRVEMYWSINVDHQNQIMNAVGKDATEIIQANRLLEKQAIDLQKKNEDLEQFTYVASHDLQEPLRMISGFLSQLEKNYSKQLDEKAQLYIEYAVDGANRLKQIILDLLRYSRAGISDEEPYKVDLNKIIEEVEILFKKIITEKEASFTYPTMPIVTTYKAAARQVFQNLIENALRYNSKGEKPQIRISVKELKEFWQFGVHDKGIGIAPQHQDKIFVIFKRLHSKKLFTGSGLGLAVSKKIVEDMGGQIWVESVAEKGSDFYFTIPKVKN